MVGWRVCGFEHQQERAFGHLVAQRDFDLFDHTSVAARDFQHYSI